MDKFVRASLLALAIVHNSTGVQAITLRTLMENQLAADSEMQSDSAIQSLLEEQAVMNVARDI